MGHSAIGLYSFTCPHTLFSTEVLGIVLYPTVKGLQVPEGHLSGLLLMAHHQQSNHDRMLAAQGLSTGTLRSTAGGPTTGDDELTSDLDEPPDKGIHFAKLKTSSVHNLNEGIGHGRIASPTLTCEKKESLLTQALLSSPELHPMSDTEAPVLTSDGGLTSPTRTTSPSPPWPKAHTSLRLSIPKEHQYQDPDQVSKTAQNAHGENKDQPHETSVEAGLGRKRCITFACGRQSSTQKSNDSSVKAQATTKHPAQSSNPPKRPCMLKFACPMKPPRNDAPKKETRGKSPSPIKNVRSVTGTEPVNKLPGTSARTYGDSDTTIKQGLSPNTPLPAPSLQSRKGRIFNRVDFQKSEATRFHEFACNFTTEDEWTNEQTAYRQKITVNDTLRKENAIRKLAEEAEEEALDEEDEEEFVDDDDENDSLRGDFGRQSSDDGNETDDEEGFADSDDESDNNSDYQFWTPGITTAATSTDHLDHIRPSKHEVVSETSIDSPSTSGKDDNDHIPAPSHSKTLRLRPGTPDLPDSSDFVVGTVDEDRPLEEAYMSCLEQRRRSKHSPIPQDIDPSFPRSEPEPEAENDEDGEDNESGENDVNRVDDTHEWVMGSQLAAEDGDSHPPANSSGSNKAIKPLTLSPKRVSSPPPKGVATHRSPLPRRLFGHCTHRLRSPPPTHRKFHSPPSSRRPSLNGSPAKTGVVIAVPHLAQRPNLTHTTSLPRTPNPFWGQHRRSHYRSPGSPTSGTSSKSMSMNQNHTDMHSRGPIDIVQGLESKRQRRKDKFWRQQCRAGGKEKHRRCQPGKGAERMRELGLEMADRFRGYGQKEQLVLSI